MRTKYDKDLDVRKGLIIAMADKTIPEWRLRDRTANVVFAKTLVIKALQEEGCNLTIIKDVVNLNHATVIYHSKKDISRKYIAQAQRDTLDRWEKVIQTKGYQIKIVYAKQLAAKMLSLLSTSSCAIKDEDGSISLIFNGKEV